MVVGDLESWLSLPYSVGIPHIQEQNFEHPF
jgi:hypothetical protein